jgi:hypothetical protein
MQETDQGHTRRVFSVADTGALGMDEPKHPATAQLYEQIHTLWQENVAPYDWDKLNSQQRAELLESYTSPDVVRRIFEHQRWKWSGEMEELSRATGAQVYADILKWWKYQNRLRRGTRCAQTIVST